MPKKNGFADKKVNNSKAAYLYTPDFDSISHGVACYSSSWLGHNNSSSFCKQRSSERFVENHHVDCCVICIIGWSKKCAAKMKRLTCFCNWIRTVGRVVVSIGGQMWPAMHIIETKMYLYTCIIIYIFCICLFSVSKKVLWVKFTWHVINHGHTGLITLSNAKSHRYGYNRCDPPKSFTQGNWCILMYFVKIDATKVCPCTWLKTIQCIS